MCICVCVCVYMSMCHMCIITQRSQKWVLDALEPELQVTVSYLTWVLLRLGRTSLVIKIRLQGLERWLGN